MLHILCALSLSTLFTLSSQTVFPSCSKPPFSTQADETLHDLENTNSTIAQPRAVFALSHRLLAYVSLTPPAQPSSPSRQPRASAWNIEADLGHAAIKVGESVLSGVKALGGMAYSAARAKAGLSGSGSSGSSGGGGEQGVGRFFSRSGPSARDLDVRVSPTLGSEAALPGDHPRASPPDAHVPPSSQQLMSRASASGSGCHVTVVDLDPLRKTTGGGEPVVVAEFMASKSQPIIGLQFSRDGNSLVVVPKDGQVLPLYQIRPITTHHQDLASRSGSGSVQSALHMYNLRRGRTSAVVEAVDIARDLRWVAIATRNRTVHTFAVNPYGGRPDARSHIEGRVRNCVEMVRPRRGCLFFVF
jgi:hypothetical protein